MSGFSKSLVVGGFAAAAMVATFAAPAAAFSVQTIDPSTLSQPERTRALTAPLGDTGPFGEPAGAGCQWSRIQVPTPQGLRWVDVEDCDSSN